MSFELSGKKTSAVWALLLIFVLSGCTEKDEAQVLPQRLGDLDLTAMIRGDEAERIVREMHGKALGEAEYIIGYYGEKRLGNILYVSLFENEDAAREDLLSMSMKMASGSTPFAPLVFDERDDGIYLKTEGMGFAHFFYRRDRALVWWQVMPEYAESTYRELVAFNFSDAGN